MLGRPKEYRELIMKLLVQKKGSSPDELRNELPLTDRMCTACNGGNLTSTCKECKNGNSKPHYNTIFREIKKLEKDECIDQVEETKHHGKPRIRYDITTNGAKWIIDNDSSLDITKFGNMLLSRSTENNSYKIFNRDISKKDGIEKLKEFKEKEIRDVGFSFNDIIQYYETSILKVSREFVFPQNTLKNINRLQYFVDVDFNFLEKSLPILNILCKKEVLTFESLYDNVKSDVSLSKFKKIFPKLATMGLLVTYSKNNVDFFSLSFTGLMAFYFIVSVSNNKTSLKHVQKYSTILLPRLFTNKVFSKLSKGLDISDLLDVMFSTFFINRSRILLPQNDNSDICLRLANTQDSLISVNYSKISALYFQLLTVLDREIQKDFPNFQLLQIENAYPRIHKIFRDSFYLGYRVGRDSDRKITNEKLLSTIKKNLAAYKINFDDYNNIQDKYLDYIIELLKLDLLIHGDDIVQEPDYKLSLNELDSRLEKISTVIEYKVGLFLKFRYPERFESVVNNNDDLLSWWNSWNNTIIEFERQNASSLEQMIGQEVNK